jgi:ABC-2 type transport system permease protein
MPRTLQQTVDLTRASLKMLLRDRTALLSAAIFPVLFLLVFSLYDLSLSPVGNFAVGPATDQVSYFDFVLPGLLALGLMNVTMVGIAASVARFRETAVLRRLAATPVSPSAFIAGQVLARLVIALVQVVLLLALGVMLGGTIVGNPLWVLVLATLGNLTFLALGFAIAGRTASVDAANNLAGVATMPLMFLSGMFFPLASLPAAVRTLGQALPITPLVDAMRAVALDGAGPLDITGELLWLSGWVPVSFLLARLTFRITPREARRRHGMASHPTRSRAQDAATVDVSVKSPSVP